VARGCAPGLPAHRRARVHGGGGILTLDQIGYEAADLETIRAAVHAPEGLVVAAGPPGSGRRAALRAMLEERASAPWHGRPHASGALLLDSIASPTTAQLGIHAARCGHLVLSPMSLGRAAGVIGELRRLGVTDDQLLEGLSLVVGQRLIGRLCDQCAKPDERDEARRALAAALNTWLEGHPVSLRRAGPDGCARCAHRGYLALVPVYELVEIDARARSLIASGADPVELESALLCGGRSMWDRGLKLVADGITSLDALKAAIHPPR
jgi:general secretion pathway protein E